MVLLLSLEGLRASEAGKEPTKPNIVVFIADDFCGYDVACFGGPTSARTPNLDRLASEGMKLTGCYNSATVCAPTRQALLTGMYPVRSGAYPNHSAVRKGAKSLPSYLKPLGYRTACIGKEHFGPPESFPFDVNVIAREEKKGTGPSGGAGDSDDGDINMAAFEAFVESGTSPFCAYLATHEPHGPFTKGKPEEHDPKTFVLPPYLPDTAVTRSQLQGYYAEIDVMDAQIGEMMRILERTGKAANTLVIFVSEQGAGWPFAKWTLYNPGIHAAAIARWPGHIKPGSSNAALIQYEDLLPTILSAAGGEPNRMDTGCPDANGVMGFDGRSALDVLLGKTEHFRDYVFGQNTMLGINGVTTPYASRMVCDGRWKLIVNYHSSDTYPHAEFGLAKNWKLEGEKGNTFAATQAARFAKRPEFELYDLQTDPWELKNVADQGGHNGVITGLRAQLETWLKQQGDEPVKSETEAYEHQPGHEKKRNGPSAEEIAERKKQFERKDKNGDGKLSLEEFGGSSSDENAKLRFHRWDVDNDGTLSLQEYISQLASAATPPPAVCAVSRGRSG